MKLAYIKLNEIGLQNSIRSIVIYRLFLLLLFRASDLHKWSSLKAPNAIANDSIWGLLRFYFVSPIKN